MWQPIKEMRMFNSNKGLVPIQVQGVKREDGFTIIHEMQDDPEFGNIEIFSCKTSSGEFRFVARRHKSGRPTNTYEVLLSVELTSNPEICRVYSKDIESALLNFPIPNGYGHIPIEQVFFNIKGSLIRAEEYV